MSDKQPSFKQRIRLLLCAGHTVRDLAETSGNDVLLQMSDIIFTEAEAMKIANKRFVARGAKRLTAKNAKTDSLEPVRST